jgi:Protein of unknown function (DUF3500)
MRADSSSGFTSFVTAAKRHVSEWAMKPAWMMMLLALAAPLHAEDGSLKQVSAEMAVAARAFLESLDEAQSAKARIAFDDAERENWHYIPKERLGLPLKDLDERQLALQRRLLETAMSRKGLLKLDTIILLEGYLAELENNPQRRDVKKYYTSIFGEPKADGTWGWRFEGHHLSLNFTLKGGDHIAVTPSFFAANRAHVREGRLAGTRPLSAEEDLARALARSLQASGKPVVYTDRAPADILTAADRKARQLDPVGVPAHEFTGAQREDLMKLITEYADRHRPELQKNQLAEITRDFDHLRFGWAGGTEPGQAYYYRIQGADFLVEVSNFQNDANHIHTVWRDRAGDFGRDVLGGHHRGHKH